MDDPRSTGAALLAQVQPGLSVYDAAGQHLGTVRRVEFGTGDPSDTRQQAAEAIAEVRAATTTPAEQPSLGDLAVVGMGGEGGDGGHPLGPLTSAAPDEHDGPRQGIAQGILGALRPGDDRSDAARDALTRTGFVQIDSAGLFAADRYATPDQIAAVGDDAVRLRVPAGQLLSAE
jgi:hypothetical protein